jgi:hypothetical protein
MPKIHVSKENYELLTKLAGSLQVEHGGHVTPNDAVTYLQEHQKEATKP